MKKNLLLLLIALILISCSENSTNPDDGIPYYEKTTNEALLEEINFARTKPKEYAKILENMLQNYDGIYYQEPGEIRIRTNEGTIAVNEAINYLNTVQPVPALTLSVGLSKAAMDHVLDQGPSGATGHTGSDGSSPGTRIKRYGTPTIAYGENIAYGYETARDIIAQLIIDDGVPSRGHRTNIFFDKFDAVGFAFGNHKQYRKMSVMDFAGGYQEIAM